MASQNQGPSNSQAATSPAQLAAAAVVSQQVDSKIVQVATSAGCADVQRSRTPPQQQQKANNFEPLDKNSSNTLKRNPKMELSKTDLLKLLGYLEGELQARDIVIAALKSEKMKHLLSSRYRGSTSDPHVALMRDFAIVGGPIMDSDGNQMDQQVASLEALVTQQRRTQFRMAKVLKDAEIRHRSVIKELEEEKRKHEHDTAQGDDITYGLEKERTRLKKELELERQEKKQLEAELKKENEALEEEKNQKKQIVLLLLAERKKIIMKYIEERKRSEDLAQILSEEKVRIDSMAEGLEEESKKSLQMEAELEKQLAQFDIERQQYRQALAKEEKRSKETEAELERLKAEMESWKGLAALRGVPRGVGATPPPPPAKPANLMAMPNLRPAGSQGAIKGAVLGTGTPMVSSKVVQPTAMVTSVPVSGPTTGIARSVTPGQALRGTAYGVNAPQQATAAETSATTESQATMDKRNLGPVTHPTVTAGLSAAKMTGGSTTATMGSGAAPGGQNKSSSNVQVTTGGGQITSGVTSNAPMTTTTVTMMTMATATTTTSVSTSLTVAISTNTTTTTTTTTMMTTCASSTASTTMATATIAPKKLGISRGIPPPVPPNKPVVPPKKEAAVYLRRNETSVQDPGKYSGKAQAPLTTTHGHPVTGASGNNGSGIVAGTAPPAQSSIAAVSVEEIGNP